MKLLKQTQNAEACKKIKDLFLMATQNLRVLPYILEISHMIHF